MKKAYHILIISTIILIIILIGYFKYKNYQEKKEVIEEYKKNFFNSVVCQYDCPLASMIFNNITQLLPNGSCVKNCTKSFKEKYKDINFTVSDLGKDNLLKEMDYIIRNCRTLNKNISGINSCIHERLLEKKEKYLYLS